MLTARSIFTSAATICLIAGAASAQVDAQAKKTLEDSAKAIKAAPGFTFHVKRWMDGMPMLKYGGEADFKMVRTATPATTLGYYAKGKTDIPGQGEQNTEVLSFDGAWITWIDEAKKTVFEHPIGPGTEAAGVYFRTKITLVPPILFDDEPYAAELKAGKMVMEAPAEVKGEACKVIRVTLKDGDAERLIYVGVNDNLPRRFEQIKIMGNGKMAPVWEISAMKAEKHDLAKMKIETPSGYTRDKRDALAPVAAPAPKPTPGTPDATKALGPVLPGGLLRVGADAPAFDLPVIGKGTDKVSLASLKGNAVVLTFWGTRFPQSLEMLPVMEEVNKAFAGKSVKMYSIASREDSPEAVGAWVEGAKPGVPALLAAQATPDAYGVRGFPSTIILDGTGKVIQCIEGPASVSSITTAVENALKAGK
ncbi:MAG: TlpA family protein disulfide reductase [Phycisphaerales bacterium]